jgi:hypothetical protein
MHIDVGGISEPAPFAKRYPGLSGSGGFGEVERQQVADVGGFFALRQLSKHVA